MREALLVSEKCSYYNAHFTSTILYFYSECRSLLQILTLINVEQWARIFTYHYASLRRWRFRLWHLEGPSWFGERATVAQLYGSTDFPRFPPATVQFPVVLPANFSFFH